jgi:hypothetical protein
MYTRNSGGDTIVRRHLNTGRASHNQPVAEVVNGLVDAGQVFWVRSAHDIFRKVHRERRRFERAESDREGMSDQVDAAINFAITAWPVTDWVWPNMRTFPRE